jgi:hypothetical protein
LERGVELEAVADEKKIGGGKTLYETVLVLKPSFSDEDLYGEEEAGLRSPQGEKGDLSDDPV